jgi:hypothetical protein
VWLTLFLLFVAIANGVTAVLALAALLHLEPQVEMSPVETVMMALLCLGNLMCAVAAWYWRRWGVYAFVLLAIPIFFFNLSIRAPFLMTGIGVYVAAKMIYLVRPIWSSFR